MDLTLTNILEDINYNDLPETWYDRRLERFSSDKNLFDYQISALQSVVKSLFLYYEDFLDYEEFEDQSSNLDRKNLFEKLYQANNAPISKLSLKPLKKNEDLLDIYGDFYDANSDGSISFNNFTNRLSLWMATGSGKTLVIVKLFELLNTLVKNSEIPSKDILFLAPTERILEQTKDLIDEYNADTSNDRFVKFISLKEYESHEHHSTIQFEDEIKVYYYRSDLISDVQGNSRLDFKHYENNGEWYIVLDEAHKGGKESSKQQAYFSIMSRNGYLFNLSATFSEQLDYSTTAFNFNLEKFIKSGFGKNIYISDSTYNFNNSNDDRSKYNKELIVTTSLISLTAAKMAYEKIKSDDYYHSPLMVTLAQTVTNTDSDLHIFFEELKKFAEGNYSPKIFAIAKEELVKELKKNGKYTFEKERHNIDIDIISNLNPSNVLENVFNSKGHSSIEYVYVDNKKEIGLKLKSSEIATPFALIRIGEISNWKNDILKGYEHTGSFEDKHYFENLNKTPDINILMGSRSFYEGWDSTRPNILNCINLGKSDAKKFILQAIGRGIRIEPLKNKRKRINSLLNSGEIDKKQFNSLQKSSSYLETLFIFATDNETVSKILSVVDDQSSEGSQKIIELDRRRTQYPLYIPRYQEMPKEVTKLKKIKISQEDLNRFIQDIKNTPNSVMVLNYNVSYKEVKYMRKLCAEPKVLFTIKSDYTYSNLSLLYAKVIRFLRTSDKKVSTFTNIEDGKDLVHFKQLKVNESDFKVLESKINAVKKYANKNNYTSEEYINMLEDGLILKKTDYKDLQIKYISSHFYYPLIYSNKKDISYIKHIIKEESEVSFLNELGTYIESNKDKINAKYDWWMFSKLDETLDSITIPYFENGNLKNFKPDFIFWLCNEQQKDYKIVFVDPKGVAYSSAINKVGSFNKLFHNKIFNKNKYKITVELKLYNEEIPFDDDYYSKYWTNDLSSIFDI